MSKYKIEAMRINKFVSNYSQYVNIDIDELSGIVRVYKNYPVVYILYSKSKIYVGHTNGLIKRMTEHKQVISDFKLSHMIVVYGASFNMSITRELETILISCMLSEKRTVLNIVLKQKLKDYSNKWESYNDIFIPLWNDLKKRGLVNNYHTQMEMTLLYRYSPFKKLSNQQKQIVDNICGSVANEQIDSKIVVEGEPGTGKSLLTSTIVYELNRNYGLGFEKIGVVMPNKNLPVLFKNLFKKLNLNVEVGTAAGILKPPYLYHTIIVDEGQRLKKYYSKDGWMFPHLKKDEVENNELVQLKKKARNIIIFYDGNQGLRPSDIDKCTFNNDSIEFERSYLNNQYRIRGNFRQAESKDYIFALRNILQMDDSIYNPAVFAEYDFGVLKSMDSLNKWVLKMHNIPGSERSRMLSGYAFEWKSKKNKKAYDFEEGLFRARWNKTSTKWVESKNSINEVGCSHSVLGVDLNYIGVIIGNDLDFDEKSERLIANRKSFFDSKGSPVQKEDANDELLLDYIKHHYYILLSRGIDGCRVYFTNKKVETYFRKKIISI